MYRSVLILLAAILMNSCGPGLQMHESDNSDGTVLAGTVHFVAVERGCWQFEDSDGKEYELVGDNARELFIDGMRARIVVRPLQGLASTCQVGVMVEVVRVLETGGEGIEFDTEN
ncbi:MAG: hypothetical protein ACKVRP_12510 [Bacteroidota bacterium]